MIGFVQVSDAAARIGLHGEFHQPPPRHSLEPLEYGDVSLIDIDGGPPKPKDLRPAEPAIEVHHKDVAVHQRRGSRLRAERHYTCALTATDDLSWGHRCLRANTTALGTPIERPALACRVSPKLSLVGHVEDRV